jgi:hypothetical protein
MEKLGDVKRRRLPRQALTFSVRLDPETITAIRDLAGIRGIGPTQLVRQWVLERVQIEKTAGALSSPKTSFPADLETLIRRTLIDSLMKVVSEMADDAATSLLAELDEEAELRADLLAQAGGDR